MRLAERRRELDAALLEFRDLWAPQPFREIRPVWCERLPALADQLLALPEEHVAHLNDDHAAALALLAQHVPAASTLTRMTALSASTGSSLPSCGEHWAWEIPGRKRLQIEAFAVAAGTGDLPVLDWCGGKGHLGRLLALSRQTPVHTLEIDAALCQAGTLLARRAGVAQAFVAADALATTEWPKPGGHAVALHACGELHRRLIRDGAVQRVRRFDVAPCCYYRGVDQTYQPLSTGAGLVLSHDDTRLAVTETVTAAPRETRQRYREMAWKLGFDAYRRTLVGNAYLSFKPVPSAWMRGSFSDFLSRMAEREGLAPPSASAAEAFEKLGWRRRDTVARLSIVRHAFRRAIELWLVLDLAVYLETQGYHADVTQFCERHLTPRNLLISARLA